MKGMSLLVVIGIVGAGISFGVFQNSNTEEVMDIESLTPPAHIQEDCDAINPYKPENAPGVPQGPIECPAGFDLDWDCVQLASYKYINTVAGIYTQAYIEFTRACETNESDITACEFAYETCVIDYPDRLRWCYDQLVECLDAAENTYTAAKTTIASNVAAGVAAATTTYWEDVSQCCVQGGQ